MNSLQLSTQLTILWILARVNISEVAIILRYCDSFYIFFLFVWLLSCDETKLFYIKERDLHRWCYNFFTLLCAHRLCSHYTMLLNINPLYVLFWGYTVSDACIQRCPVVCMVLHSFFDFIILSSVSFVCRQYNYSTHMLWMKTVITITVCVKPVIVHIHTLPNPQSNSHKCYKA